VGARDTVVSTADAEDNELSVSWCWYCLMMLLMLQALVENATGAAVRLDPSVRLQRDKRFTPRWRRSWRLLCLVVGGMATLPNVYMRMFMRHVHQRWLVKGPIQ
jgi:hypothetical protein